jgi:hypothetical protein
LTATCICSIEAAVLGITTLLYPLEDEPVGGEDEEDLDQLDPPVPDEPEILPTPPGTLDLADTPLPDRPASSIQALLTHLCNWA